MRNQRERRYSVYILGSLSGTLHIGITSNLPFRVRQHKEHTFRGFTTKYRVDRLLYYEAYGEVSTAIAGEKQLKGWKRVSGVNSSFRSTTTIIPDSCWNFFFSSPC